METYYTRAARTQARAHASRASERPVCMAEGLTIMSLFLVTHSWMKTHKKLHILSGTLTDFMIRNTNVYNDFNYNCFVKCGRNVVSISFACFISHLVIHPDLPDDQSIRSCLGIGCGRVQSCVWLLWWAQICTLAAIIQTWLDFYIFVLFPLSLSVWIESNLFYFHCLAINLGQRRLLFFVCSSPKTLGWMVCVNIAVMKSKIKTVPNVYLPLWSTIGDH